MEVVKNKKYGAHILALPYPSQGHINPMHQFCKRLVSKGLKTTLAITTFISNSTRPIPTTVVGIETVSDGFDRGGYAEAESVAAYLERFEEIGSKTLANLIKKYEKMELPITCIMYDAFMPWALDVAKEHGLIGACFFTQACTVNYIYYYVHHGKLMLPISSTPVKIPGLPHQLQLQDMPSFIYKHGTYPAYFELVLNQFRNVDKADYVFVNSFYKLEAEVADRMAKFSPLYTIRPTLPSFYMDNRVENDIERGLNLLQVADTMAKFSPLYTIGPTLPSFYMDNRIENDIEYGLNLFHVDNASTCINWLNTKPEGSVVYAAFGSMSSFDKNQMEEIAHGLKATNSYFLWVIPTSELEAKIPEKIIEETRAKGLVIKWSPQLRVLSNKAIGCFFSHGGWNSTVEALSFGVPMVVMPQWTDQTTNAKLVQDVWCVGVRTKVNDEGIVVREEIEECVNKVLKGEEGKEMKKNAIKWKDLAKEAVDEGGTTDRNIEEFVSKCTMI